MKEKTSIIGINFSVIGISNGLNVTMARSKTVSVTFLKLMRQKGNVMGHCKMTSKIFDEFMKEYSKLHLQNWFAVVPEFKLQQ